MLEKNFVEYSPHIEGLRILIDATVNNFASLGADDILHQVSIADNRSLSHELKNREALQITAFAMHPQTSHFFAFGASNGVVKLNINHQLNLQNAEIVFKGDRPIRSLSFSEAGQLLAITTDEQHAIVYCLQNKKLYKLAHQHEGFVINIFFGRNHHVASLGAQGNLHLYSVILQGQKIKSEDQEINPFAQSSVEVRFEFIQKYRICVESISRKYAFLSCCFAYLFIKQSEKNVIIAAGQNSLQEISIDNRQSLYRIQRRICEQKQILMTEVLNSGANLKAISLITATEHILSIWNYSTFQKIMCLNTAEILNGTVTSLRRINLTHMPSFIFLINNFQSNGKIYQFKDVSILDIPIPKQQVIVQPIEEQKTQIKQAEIKKHRPFESISTKLIPQYPQQLLEKGYEQFLQLRFLFYNSVGCVIQRIQQDSSVLQLELHDKSKPNRLKIKDSNRLFDMFALREKVFVYASSNLLVFQQQKQLKQGYQGWEFRWANINGIAIGSSWIAAINDQQIKVLDYAGNQIHTICFDRKLVTMEAYEDLLVVVYHHNLPMWDCQNLKMRIYRVTLHYSHFLRDAVIPLKFQSRMKWFGFSQQGMIFCQDTLEVLRCYRFDRDEWQIVFSLEGKPERLYIQHIEGTDAYGFRIQQKQGQTEQPRVSPRSYPLKIPLQIPDFKFDFLSNDETLYLKKIVLKNLMISHDTFRWQTWYKYKYSRRKDHPQIRNIKTIKSEEEIKTSKAQVDAQLYDYVKKFISRLQQKGQIKPSVVQSLMMICQRQTHYEQTRQKIKEILTNKYTGLIPDSFQNLTFLIAPRNSRCKTKINQISILEQMLSAMSNYQ